MRQKIIHWFIRKMAAKNGFLDPFALLDRMRSFSRPSKVQEPIELIRAGAVFHARGLLNTKAIQHNLDWIWPYWTEKQFDPHSPSFLPRAFSATHINLTHRNWTAVGLPDCLIMPIVDPRGMVTPFYDGWSVDTWFIPEGGESLFASRAEDVSQGMGIADNRQVVMTRIQQGSITINLESWLSREGEAINCQTKITTQSDLPGKLVVSLRPCNPEGVSLIDQIEVGDDPYLDVNNGQRFYCTEKPSAVLLSNYDRGDVLDQLIRQSSESPPAETSVKCASGMATAALVFDVQPSRRKTLCWKVDCRDDPSIKDLPSPNEPYRSWPEALATCPRFSCPDATLQSLYQQALISLTLLSPQEVYPGPYTYRRFWFRDAALMMQALIFAGQFSTCRGMLDAFPERQTRRGYFHSQEGEWDSNGQVLWIYDLFRNVSGTPLSEDDLKALEAGADWIIENQIRHAPGQWHQDLLPPGFSAEHLGPIDYYWWDNFWALGGLKAAAHMFAASDPKKAEHYQKAADSWENRIDQILKTASERLNRPAIAAGPYRRMDAGAIGSIVGSYPLRLHQADDQRVLDTVRYLQEDCFFEGAFFQEMIHSGVNAYLSIHIAQVLMRSGDASFMDIVQTVAGLATDTGQWPEAIHPATKGGCMGDGHHGWASAEWFMMIRNMMIREEEQSLILGNGLIADQLSPGDHWSFGPAPTSFGEVRVMFDVSEGPKTLTCKLEQQWRLAPETIRVHLQGIDPVVVDPNQEKIEIQLP